MSGTSTIEIIGFILFGLSEIIAVLHIPANGFLHSLSIGLKNSIKNSNQDIEIAQQLVSNKPDIASVFNKIANNTEVSNVIKKLSDRPDVVPFVEILLKQPQLQYILTLLKNNPDIVNDVKQLIETNITQNQIQRQIVQQQIVQQRQLLIQNNLPILSTEQELENKLKTLQE